MGPCVVGIGASAGGLEAMREFFRAMPPDSGMAFVVIQHLDPDHKSLTAELLAKCTAMRVLEAVDGMAVEPNYVYTLPPNRYLDIGNGILRLSTPSEPRGHRLPIDHFFRSLGEDQRQKAIGIVLSGSGSDGALGLKSIVAHGGIVLVQDPQAAQFDGMPRSAIATGLVTYAMAVEAMPEALIRYARHPYATGGDSPPPGSKNGPGSLPAILTLVQGRSGYNFSGYKAPTLIRRIHRRMGLRRVEGMPEYWKILEREPEEIDALFKDMLIGVTEFFRDPGAWEWLAEHVIKPLVAAKLPNEPVRVWVAGAASGEEAYTVAMLLLERLQADKKHCPVQVFASDTNDSSLKFARAGVYPEGIAAQVSAQRLSAFFVKPGDEHQYQVSEALRSAVVFGAHNLFVDPPFSKLDLVCCRNLLIYVEPELQRKAMRLFHFALLPGAHLFLGSAETVGQDARFRPVSEKWRIYQRVGTGAPEPLELSPVGRPQAAAAAGYSPRRTLTRTADAASLAQRLILDRFAPAGVLVDAKFNVLYFCGPTDRYLAQPTGLPTQDLLTLLREGLRSRVRSAAREALDTHLPVVVEDARVRGKRGYEPVRLNVIPAGVSEHRTLLLVVFEDLPKAISPAPGGRGDALARQLEEELRVTREDLQSTIERLEISAEEMKVSNEEVTSINEELQSINEELESSKEEMQSLNEELGTVNQQLRAKVAEIEAVNRDLDNLLSSSDIATVRLDNELRIRWFSPATGKVFNIIGADIGRPIADLVPIVPGPILAAEARKVMETGTLLQTEAQTEHGEWYARRILPLRNGADRIDGVIVTYADITNFKNRDEAELAARATLARTLEDRVQRRTRELSTLLAELSAAEERERRNISVELHDGPGQLLTLAGLKLAALDRKALASECVLALDEVGGLIAEVDKLLRSLIFQVSPPVLYELGLVAAVRWLADEMRATYGLVVEVTDDGRLAALDTNFQVVLFRAVRELLINVAKHAMVGTATVHLRRHASQIEITVGDAGVGFDALPAERKSARRGFGLGSVHERLSFLGGSFHVDSIPGDGTVAVLTAPLRRATDAKDPAP